MRCGGPCPDRATAPTASLSYLRAGRFSTYHLPHTGRQPPSHLALSGANVDHPSATGQQVHGHRKKLFFILSVGTVGKPLLPPTGKALPDFERVTH